MPKQKKGEKKGKEDNTHSHARNKQETEQRDTASSKTIEISESEEDAGYTPSEQTQFIMGVIRDH